MLNGINRFLRLLKIVSERPNMTDYFQSIGKPTEYYTGRARLDGILTPILIWEMKKIGESKTFKINGIELSQNFTPCSPFEAIGSVFR